LKISYKVSNILLIRLSFHLVFAATSHSFWLASHLLCTLLVKRGYSSPHHSNLTGTTFVRSL